MNKLIKNVLRLFARNNVSWFLLDYSILPIARYLDKDRARFIRRKTPRHEFKKCFPDLIVKHGPFKGMRYPQGKSKGSVLFPKLLGSYERELHSVIGRICESPYTEIIDIGCAEGFYAVGLAMRIPNAKIYAFDTDLKATQLCEEMASLNVVDHRVITGKECNKDKLLSLPLTKKALIVCDCEGCEKYIFDEEVVEKLAKHDFLIETHDCFDINISSYLSKVFSKTHDCQIVESLDDIKKAKSYQYPELENYDLSTRKALVGEMRLSIMEWYFFTSRE